MNEIDQIEQELTALRKRFAESGEVLEELARLKTQFAGLLEQGEVLQSNLSRTETLFKNIPDQSKALEVKLAQIESQFETRSEQLQAQLTNFRFDFDAMGRQLQEKIEQDHQGLARLEELQKKGAANPDGSDRIQWIESSLQHFNSTLYTDRAAMQKLERRYNELKRYVDTFATVSGIVGFLMLLGLLFLR